jgi:hypothetical protein
MRLLNQKGFTSTSLVIIAVVLLMIAVAGYYTSNTIHRGTIDVKELGIKLTFSNINGWTYIIDPGTNNSTVDLEYQGYASGRLTRYNAPPSDPNILDQKQLGSYYFGLTRQPCPCNPIGEQAFNKLTSALNSATVD